MSFNLTPYFFFLQFLNRLIYSKLVFSIDSATQNAFFNRLIYSKLVFSIDSATQNAFFNRLIYSKLVFSIDSATQNAFFNRLSYFKTRFFNRLSYFKTRFVNRLSYFKTRFFNRLSYFKTRFSIDSATSKRVFQKTRLLQRLLQRIWEYSFWNISQRRSVIGQYVFVYFGAHANSPRNPLLVRTRGKCLTFWWNISLFDLRSSKLVELSQGLYHQLKVDWLIWWCFTSLSTIFQSCHGDSSHYSCLSWISPVLDWGSEVSCPRTLSRKTQDLVRLEPRTFGLRVKHFTTELVSKRTKNYRKQTNT